MDQYFVLTLSIFVHNGRLKNLQYKIKTSRCIFFFFLEEGGEGFCNSSTERVSWRNSKYFDDLWSAFITFYVWNNLNWICLREINIFVCFGESTTVLFSPTTNIDSEIFSYLAGLVFSASFFEDIDFEVHSKVPNCFCSKVLKLINLINRCRGEFKIISSSFCKRKLQRTNKI